MADSWLYVWIRNFMVFMLTVAFCYLCAVCRGMKTYSFLLVIISISSIILLIVPSIHINHRAYDQYFARKALYYAYGSYCDEDYLRMWDCTWCRNVQDFDIVNHSAGIVNTDGQQAFIGYDSGNNQIVLSFRGTHDAEAWVADLDAKQIAYPWVELGFVHEGFYGAWKSLEHGGLAAKLSALTAAHPRSEVLLTGHSLGAALAQIAALEIRSSYHYKSMPIGAVNVIAFGAPRWANRRVAEHYDQVINSSWRIINQDDIVVTMPSIWSGYHHTGMFSRSVCECAHKY